MQRMFELAFSFFSSFFKVLSFKSTQTGQALPRIHSLRPHQQESTPKTPNRSTQDSTCFLRSLTRRLNCHQLLRQHVNNCNHTITQKSVSLLSKAKELNQCPKDVSDTGATWKQPISQALGYWFPESEFPVSRIGSTLVTRLFAFADLDAPNKPVLSNSDYDK
ncbi:hypothetical protein RJ641_025489 [Dillenia turbinata]|uniref:Uncharacterized protein n=1 Tax=Dillenia turbinata TaxID=194707 RepID=A0AAN8ZP00_9MAGN